MTDAVTARDFAHSTPRRTRHTRRWFLDSVNHDNQIKFKKYFLLIRFSGENLVKFDKSKTRNLGSGHSIEIGESTWDENEISIRNRYSTSTGRFNQAGSSELPIDDIFQITKVAAEEDLLHSKTLIELIEIFSASLKRQVN